MYSVVRWSTSIHPIIIIMMMIIVRSFPIWRKSLNRTSAQVNLLANSPTLQVNGSIYFHSDNYIIRFKKRHEMAYFWLSCLCRMRTTFLLPLARMLEAFYRAIKAVNQSLLNDPWFLTCFTGSDTVVAADCTHGFTLCGLPSQSRGCLDYEYTSWQCYCIASVWV